MSLPLLRLGDVADISGGITKNSRRSGLPNRRPYVTVANVYANRLDLTQVGEIGVLEADLARASLQLGDVLMVEGNGSLSQLGRSAAWNDEIPGCVHQNHLIKIRPRSNVVESRWVLYWTMSPGCRGQIERLGSSTSGLHTLSISKVEELKIAFCGISEQRRIVAEIEKQFTRLDAAEASLERVKANLRRARASVLQAAVEGRLVPTEASLARAEGRDYEPASVLLARMLDERKAKWPKGKKYVEPVISSSPSDGTPSGWSWVTMDQIAWVSGYGTSVKCDHSAGGPPVLRIPNVQKTVIDLTDIKYATESESLKSDGVVAPGDFLFIRTNGSLDLIGRGAMVMAPPPTETWFASYLIRLRLCGTADTWRWILFVWESRIVRRYIERDAASSAGQYNVSLSAAAQYQIPLPPLAEQRRIVAEVERRLTILDSLAATVERRLESCKHLRQSILKRAFEGKLVPQEPNDEPASALLARLPKPAKPTKGRKSS